MAVFAELQAKAEPTILVLDEPFVFLHPAVQRHVMELFESAAWTFQVILAEHSLIAYERRHHGWSATVLVPEAEHRSRISQEDAYLELLGGS
ncbi:AAA family ATPase [Streptomyces sp. NPDC085639]|uniref:AAA family ATPase n=1 Tax=Streptomyces sp. NPDC085639 TaxID=3365734 RepID=UPI0037D94AF7